MPAIDLKFSEWGHPDQPTLIIVHGFLASSRNWRHIAKSLATRYHVFCLDMRNHGESPHAEAMDYPLMVEDISQFITHHQLGSITILGHSMGGKAAMWTALTWPDIIRQLIVVDIAPVPYQHGFDKILQALTRVPLDQISNRKQAEVWLSHDISDEKDRKFLLQNLAFKEGHYSWSIDLDIISNIAPNITGFPETIEVEPFVKPTLFVKGEHSVFIKDEYRSVIANYFPGALYADIADSGHWIHVENPQAFIECVMEFLKKT